MQTLVVMPGVNQIQKTDKKPGRWNALLIRWRWVESRLKFSLGMWKASTRSGEILLSIQKFKQRRDDMAFAGRREDYLYWQGYVDGIKHVLRESVK